MPRQCEHWLAMTPWGRGEPLPSAASRGIGGCHLPRRGRQVGGRFVNRPYGEMSVRAVGDGALDVPFVGSGRGSAGGAYP